MNPISILFCDIDDTLTGTLSGHKFKQSPDDIVILPGFPLIPLPIIEAIDTTYAIQSLSFV